MAARNGAQLTGDSIASVAARTPNMSGTIAGDIADRSLANYMPHMSGMNVSGTEITGGQITAKVVGADGKETSVAMYLSLIHISHSIRRFWQCVFFFGTDRTDWQIRCCTDFGNPGPALELGKDKSVAIFSETWGCFYAAPSSRRLWLSHFQ